MKTADCAGTDRAPEQETAERALLCGYPYFFIPSKGLIINFHEVDAQNADTFTMSNGSLIPISRRKAKEVTDAYSSFLFEQLRKGGKR